MTIVIMNFGSLIVHNVTLWQRNPESQGTLLNFEAIKNYKDHELPVIATVSAQTEEESDPTWD